MTLIEKFNTVDFKTTCLHCGKHNIQKPDVTRGGFDWICLYCGTRQLDYIKARGFRYYAFLLSGSWCSEYFYARSINEGYRYAKKYYKNRVIRGEEHEVLKSYMVGAVDAFVLSNWMGFE